MLQLYTFGGCHLMRDGVRLDALSTQKMGLALLAMVSASGERGVSREKVLAALWTESDEERARTSLRQLVHALRTQLAEPDLLLPSAELRLNPTVITSDVTAFREALTKRDPAGAAALYSGPFLEGFHLRASDGFERWSDSERAALTELAAQALSGLAAQVLKDGDPHRAVELCRRLAHIDPLRARYAISLMTALEAAGERAAALQHARVYESLIRQMDATPDVAVTELATRLKNAAPTAPLVVAQPPIVAESPVASTAATTPQIAPQVTSAASRKVSFIRTLMVIGGVAAIAWLSISVIQRNRRAKAQTADRPRSSTTPAMSVAVLPFANTSGDPANEPLSDGLTDELIGALGKIPGLKVAGRTSAFALKGKALSMRAVGDTLGVATVVEASVRRANDRIKVTAQLVRVADNVVLWTESYDRTLTDVFAVEEGIARAIVAALRVRLVGSVDSALARRATADPQAYDLYLRGRHIFNTRPDREGSVRAVGYFEQATTRDSSYARAFASLADAHTRMAVFGFGEPRAEFARAKIAASRALTLDSTLAEAHAALAHMMFASDFDFRGAETAFLRAIALDPGYTFARVTFAICLLSEGQFAQAIAQLDSARATDPLAVAPALVLGRVFVAAGQPDRAIQQLTQVLELNPQLDLAYQQLGHAYLQKRMYPAAIAAMQRAAALSGIRDSAHLAYAYAASGARTVAQQIVTNLVNSSGTRYVPPYHIALAYAGLGESDIAFDWLDKAYVQRASFMSGVKVEPGFAGLRRDMRWSLLLRKMGLEP